MNHNDNPYQSPVDEARGACTSVSEVEFDFTQQDSSWFAMRENRDHLVRRTRIVLLSLAIVFSLVSLGLWVNIHAVVALPLAIFSVFFFYRALFVRRTIDRSTQRAIDRMRSRRESKGVFGRRTIKMADQGIHIDFPAGHAMWKWWAVPEIVADSEYLLIYIASYDAILVPARAFATNGHFEKFVKNAERLWGNSNDSIAAG